MTATHPQRLVMLLGCWWDERLLFERTILNLANTGLDIVQAQVAHLLFETVEIHRIFFLKTNERS
jgi:hypothetical protein